MIDDDKRGKRDRAPDSDHYVMRWLYYSDYLSCPQKYLWTWGHEEIDLGNGLGNGKTPSDNLSTHESAMGIAIAYAIELFFNDKMWREPSHDKLKSDLKKIVTTRLKEECTLGYINWGLAPSLAEMEIVCTEGVFNFLTTIKGNRLLTPNTQSEIILRHLLDEEFYIKGTLDILMEENGKYTILDGKNTKYRNKYLKRDQLLYYALLVYLNEGVLVERLGWLYYRFPFQEGNPNETGVEYIEYNLLDLNILLSKVRLTWNNIKAKKFPATPSSFECRFCPFQSACSDKHVPKKRSPKEHSSEVINTTVSKEGRKIVSFDSPED